MTTPTNPAPDPRLPAWYRSDRARAKVTFPKKRLSAETLRGRRLRRKLDQNHPHEDLILRIDRHPVECPKPWPGLIRIERRGDYIAWPYLKDRRGTLTPSTEMIHSIFLHREKMNYQREGMTRESYHSLMVKFFTWQRVSEILRTAQQCKSGLYMRGNLSSHLFRTGRGQDPAIWRYQIGWFKSRILECFDAKDLPADRWTLLLYYRIPLDEILKLPLRDPTVEPEETLWPDF
jgi:hypothetical protein